MTAEADNTIKLMEAFNTDPGYWRYRFNYEIKYKADYSAAAETLANWEKIAPEAGDDPYFSFGRVWSQINTGREFHEQLEHYFDRRPRVIDRLRQAIGMHWAVFNQLPPEVQNSWLRACWVLFNDAVPADLQREAIEDVAFRFGKTIEMCLQMCLFQPFKEYVREHPTIRERLRIGIDKKSLEHLLGYLEGDYNLGLADMRSLLNMCTRRGFGPAEDLAQWLNRRHGALVKGWPTCNLELVRVNRGKAGHMSVNLESEIGPMARECIKLLSLLMSSARP
jgi:hypothetical protein